MNTSLQRILLFLITLPLVGAMVLFIPYKSHLPVNIATTLLSGLGAQEFGMMLRKRGCTISHIEALALGILGPLAATLNSSFGIQQPLLTFFLIAGAAWILVSHVFFPIDKLKDTVNYMAAGFSIMIYPGLFILWVIRMTQLTNGSAHTPGFSLFPDQPGIIILVFLLAVVGNDSMAWAMGMLFGKDNKGIIPASPNKSIAGFAGGLFASTLVCVVAACFIPQVFPSRKLPAFISGIFMGFGTAAATSLGDLAESVIKRSADMKDSGFIVPGRGGILDSIDSIAFAAPVFYGLYWLLFM